jgi:hypothetical protein
MRESGTRKTLGNHTRPLRPNTYTALWRRPWIGLHIINSRASYLPLAVHVKVVGKQDRHCRVHPINQESSKIDESRRSTPQHPGANLRFPNPRKTPRYRARSFEDVRMFLDSVMILYDWCVSKELVLRGFRFLPEVIISCSTIFGFP